MILCVGSLLASRKLGSDSRLDAAWPYTSEHSQRQRPKSPPDAYDSCLPGIASPAPALHLDPSLSLPAAQLHGGLLR